MLKHLTVLLLVAALLLGGSAVGVAQDESAEFDRISRSVSKLRGLEIKTEIDEAFLTRAQLRKRLEASRDKASPAEELDNAGRLLVAFGLAPEGTDLRKLLISLYSEQIGGYYDPRSGDMFLIDSDTNLDPLGEFIYAHEVTHALQDQHYGLQRLLARARGRDDDAELALDALVEGDATMVQIEYLRNRPALTTKVLAALGRYPTRQADRAPAFITRTAGFPYNEGLSFVAALRARGGWKAVDAAFGDPPSSTEQIMHPARYLNRDEPTVVTLPDLETALGAGWKRLDENRFGEFQTALLLGGERPGPRELAAAAGWDGDRFQLWAKRGNEVVIWRTVWDSARDAREFAAALRRYDEARFSARYTLGRGALTLQAGGRAARIDRRRVTVSYVLAPTAAIARKVGAALDAPRAEVPAMLPNTGGGGGQRAVLPIGPIATAER